MFRMSLKVKLVTLRLMISKTSTIKHSYWFKIEILYCVDNFYRRITKEKLGNRKIFFQIEKIKNMFFMNR